MKSLCLQFGCLVSFFPPVFKRKYLLNRERFSGRIFRSEIMKYLYLAHFMFCIRGIEITCIIVLASVCVRGANLKYHFYFSYRVSYAERDCFVFGLVR